MLTVAVLGPVEVRRDGEPVPVPGGKTTEVLVRLALEAGRPVRAERIIEDLWTDAASTGRNTLQSKVSQLRRALGDPGLVAAAGGGYLLDVDPAHVDALAVQGLAESATTSRREGDATHRGRDDDRGAGAVPGRRAGRRGGRRLAAAAPGPPRRGTPRPGRGPDGGAGGAGIRWRRDRRARGPGGAAPPARGPVVVADHRALPHGSPGGRAGGVRAGAQPAARPARRRSRTRPAQPRGADPPAEPGPGRRPGSARGGRPAREPARALLRAGGPGRRAVRRCAGWWGSTDW